MLLDDVTITIKAGNGGNGKVSFLREKYRPKGGPDGGNGGKGGSVFVVGTSDLSALNRFKFIKKIEAQNAEHGGSDKKTGKNGEDVEFHVPIGTDIIDDSGNIICEIKKNNERIMLARGGKGGKGNWLFRSATNQAPKYAEPGEKGVRKNIRLNLRFIATVGLIGLPNAGKSTLLNALTNAHAKIADYPFTTLEPNLGDLNGIIIADIPGLIEGAHNGRGLGVKFLKHIEKTHVLIHCLDITSENLKKDYETIKNELNTYNKTLGEKNEYLLLTKSDLVNEKSAKKKLKEAKKFHPHVFVFSVLNDENVKTLSLLIKNF
jgi:GTP-binding protein